MSAQFRCQSCERQVQRSPNVESYGGRVCPECLKDQSTAAYYREIYDDEADLVDHEGRFAENERRMQKYVEIAEKYGAEAANRFLLTNREEPPFE